MLLSFVVASMTDFLALSCFILGSFSFQTVSLVFMNFSYILGHTDHR